MMTVQAIRNVLFWMFMAHILPPSVFFKISRAKIRFVLWVWAIKNKNLF
jgi:hypothetical protein